MVIMCSRKSNLKSAITKSVNAAVCLSMFSMIMTIFLICFVLLQVQCIFQSVRHMIIRGSLLFFIIIIFFLNNNVFKSVNCINKGLLSFFL